jgi:hypothetical protein
MKTKIPTYKTHGKAKEKFIVTYRNRFDGKKFFAYVFADNEIDAKNLIGATPHNEILGVF